MNDPIENERLQKALILVVDDIAVNRKMLMHSLNGHGYGNIILAEDGAQALQMTRELKPDLVILDLMMPGVDGFAYCKTIREDGAYNNMPIIVQTALGEIEQKLRVFGLGASDYICKPLDPGELGARTKVHLVKKMLVEDLYAYRTRMNAEMKEAQVMQNRLMPNAQQVQMCERIFDMKIAACLETSSALGGDCWGMRALSDTRLAIYMYDFSGHGISAAMNIFRLHTIMQELIQAGSEPGNFLTNLNRQLHPLLERDEFATMFYGIIDTDANCLLYASAAVPSITLFAGHEQEPVALNGRGFPLGVLANAMYDTHYTPFMAGDLLVAYSDCLIETRNAQGEFITDQQIRETVQAIIPAAANPAQQSVEALMALLRAHSAAPIGDDITIGAYWRNPKTPR